MFFSAGARVTMKTSAKAIRNPANLMAAQYVFCALPGLVYSSFVHVGGANGTSSSSSSSSAWAAWAALSASDWGVFAILTGGVVIIGATIQVHTIRILGPAGHTALQPLRLVSTVAASTWLLGERVMRAGEWAGLTILLSAIAWYVTVGKRIGEGSGGGAQQQAVGRQSLGTVKSAEMKAPVGHISPVPFEAPNKDISTTNKESSASLTFPDAEGRISEPRREADFDAAARQGLLQGDRNSALG